jgi:hypothetical protein
VSQRKPEIEQVGLSKAAEEQDCCGSQAALDDSLTCTSHALKVQSTDCVPACHSTVAPVLVVLLKIKPVGAPDGLGDVIQDRTEG